MMWFEKFWRTISEVLPSKASQQTVERLSALNPDRFYVENVRSILGVSTVRARLICDTAVRRGVFKRQVLVLSPTGDVAGAAPTEKQLPPTVPCWHNVDGDWEKEELPTANLQTLEAYALNE